MKTLLVYVFTVVLSSVLFSCKSSRILSANFESDVVGNPPATNPAGAPAGDVIQYNPALTPQLEVQNSATAGEKALHLKNTTVALGAHNRWVNFRGISTNLVNTLWFNYTARNTSPSGNVLVDLSDGEGHLIARMRISSNGDVHLAKNILDVYTDHIGSVGTGAHTVIFTVMPSALKYNVTIFPVSGSAVTAENKPMITDNALEFANPAHPTLSFSHQSMSAGNHQYVIETASISRKEPA